MPNFKYTAYGKDGKELKGTIEAESREAALAQLKAEGNIPTNVAEEGMFDKDINLSFGAKKVAPRDLSVFCRQFVSITTAGVAIIDALEMLADQTENTTLKDAIIDTKISVAKGETLAGSMAKQGKVFPPIMINMIAAGEASGNLETAFDRMGTQFEKQTKLNSLVKKSMIYPIALLVVIVVVVIAMMVLVIPTFSDMYADMGQKLPALTQMLMTCSDFVVEKWYILIIAIALIVVGFKIFKATKQGTYLLAKLAINAPIFGELTVKSAAANFARTLSTLTASGISMIEALEIAGKTMKNVIFRDAVLEAKDKVAQGRPLSEPLKNGKVFPNMIVHMIGIGEETGNMEDMLVTAATYYEEEVEVATETVTAVIEPLIIVVMAGIVGVIIMAILIPMFGMYDIASGGEV